MSEKTQKEDRRTRYTRQVIKEAFLKLLEEKEYPKITVTEICRLAEINRGTFYLHYYDTADVLDDILNEILKETTSVIDHVFCPARTSGSCSYPFCDHLHSSDRYQALFLDDTISAQDIKKMAETTKEDIDYTVDQIREIVARLRSMSPLYEDFLKKQEKIR